ncbi:MAG: hypothetical protein O2867_04535 [Bacteroidetes bacterium]|nr:hypothetical protein [Bacteroidota bacterium]MDA0972984.1 hypothetical protein [Bacteroidota bacterium]
MSLFNLTNSREHPTDARYMVFFFSDYDMAVSFEDELVKEGLYFEKDVSEAGENKRWLYAVKRRDQARVKQLNYIATGRHRKPFIADPILRYLVLAISAGLIILAIIGYIKSQ